MIDTEVQRLRRLRNTALRARALAAALDSSRRARCSPLLSRSAVACWHIARVVTGRLRAHPYLRYQRGPSRLRMACDEISGALIGGIAHRRGRGLHTLSDELRRVVGELADARALTWSVELSDTFGRSQVQLEGLIKEALAAVRSESGTHANDLADAGPGASVDDSGNVAANWPYLAF
jgi:hypothetical protein